MKGFYLNCSFFYEVNVVAFVSLLINHLAILKVLFFYVVEDIKQFFSRPFFEDFEACHKADLFFCFVFFISFFLKINKKGMLGVPNMST